MKIILKKMLLKNFKGVAESTTYNFQPGKTEIVGTNGVGKTTIADAFRWVLTGKDLEDRKDYEIKNTKRPELNKLDHIVELTLLVDGKQQVVRRVYKETWTRKRGYEQEVYTGNETLYFINEVPFQQKQYNEVISQWFSETTLKILTDPLFFNSTNGEKWKWTHQRDALTRMSGEISTEEVFDAADIDADRRNTLENALNEGKSFELFRKEIQGKKKIANEELKGVPQSIEKLETVKPEKLDWEEVEKEIKKADVTYNTINDNLADLSKSGDESAAEKLSKRSEINRIKEANESIIAGIKAKFTKDNNEVRTKIAELQGNIDLWKTQITKFQNQVNQLTKDRELNQLKKAEYARLLAIEQATKLPEIDPTQTVCPTCGREFDDDKIDDLKKHFEENWNLEKVKLIGIIKEKGKAVVADINTAGTTINMANTELAKHKANVAAETARLEQLQKQPLKTEKDLTAELATSKEYKANNARISVLESEIKALDESTDETKKIELDKLKTKRLDADNVRLNLRDKLATRVSYDRIDKEVKELKAKQKNLNQAIADLEGLEFAIQTFNATKNTEVQKRANRLFPDEISFKLFDTQVDGTPVEFCEMWYDGKPWGALNPGHRIKAGMECINTFNEFYNLYLPVMVDNADRVASYNLPEMETQVIVLKMVEDIKELTILD